MASHRAKPEDSYEKIHLAGGDIVDLPGAPGLSATRMPRTVWGCRRCAAVVWDVKLHEKHHATVAPLVRLR